MPPVKEGGKPVFTKTLKTGLRPVLFNIILKVYFYFLQKLLLIQSNLMSLSFCYFVILFVFLVGPGETPMRRPKRSQTRDDEFVASTIESLAQVDIREWAVKVTQVQPVLQ